MNRKVITGAASGVVVAAASAAVLIGVAQAGPGEQTSQPGQTSGSEQQSERAQRMQEQREEFIDSLAQKLGVTPDQLRQAVKDTATERVDEALASGRISAEEAARIKERIAAGNLGFGPGGFAGPAGMRRGGPGGPGGFGIGIHAGGEDLATFLGIATDQLRQELRGNSLAQVAANHGKSRDELKQFLAGEFQERLTQGQTNGRINDEQAARMLTEFNARLDQMIDRELPEEMPAGGPRFRMGNRN